MRWLAERQILVNIKANMVKVWHNQYHSSYSDWLLVFWKVTKSCCIQKRCTHRSHCETKTSINLFSFCLSKWFQSVSQTLLFLSLFLLSSCLILIMKPVLMMLIVMLVMLLMLLMMLMIIKADSLRTFHWDLQKN